MEGFETLQGKLLDLRSELEGRVEKITRDIRHEDDPPEKDSGEQAVERENDEVLDGLANAAREELVKIKQALMRMEHDVYGSCTKCGAEINRARLEAIPYAERCIKCAE